MICTKSELREKEGHIVTFGIFLIALWDKLLFFLECICKHTYSSKIFTQLACNSVYIKGNQVVIVCSLFSYYLWDCKSNILFLSLFLIYCYRLNKNCKSSTVNCCNDCSFFSTVPSNINLFFSCNSIILSSTLFLTTHLIAVTFLVCPILCAL